MWKFNHFPVSQNFYVKSISQNSHFFIFAVHIDGLEWTGVKFFQLSSQWQTHIKVFPVAGVLTSGLTQTALWIKMNWRASAIDGKIRTATRWFFSKTFTSYANSKTMSSRHSLVLNARSSKGGHLFWQEKNLRGINWIGAFTLKKNNHHFFSKIETKKNTTTLRKTKQNERP